MKSQILEFKIPTCTFIQACMFIVLEELSHLYVYYHLYVYSVLKSTCRSPQKKSYTPLVHKIFYTSMR